MAQKDEILKDLKRGLLLTPVKALERYGCFRLAARIYDLRSEGHMIGSFMHRDGYAIYYYER